ncbi:hypothetical protein A1019T_00366 [Psychrobacter pasteurii]|uniref:Uncharacterized protein n=1 Tax=Psychrobacter pasteurii TaxID=1945520 RepID=A0A1R4ED32_9GAMM|nr:hypothetical protein A1019T_00366 [Psychrobacter pasteurii]
MSKISHSTSIASILPSLLFRSNPFKNYNYPKALCRLGGVFTSVFSDTPLYHFNYSVLRAGPQAL